MATLTNSDIKACITEIQIIDRIAECNGTLKTKQALPGELYIQQYSPSFKNQIGLNPTHSLLISSNTQAAFFHSSCIFWPAYDELYTTSTLLPANPNSTTTIPSILISRLKLRRNKDDVSIVNQVEWSKLRPPPGIDMPSGGFHHRDSIIFCAQGNLRPATGGIYSMPRSSKPTPLVTNFHGRDFNSPRDVVIAMDGAIWFIDTRYGHERDFRAEPKLPCVVYRYVPETGDIRVMADGFVRPAGITFAPGEGVVYVSDDGMAGKDDIENFSKPATIYAFNIDSNNGFPFLTNRRVFAHASVGCPRGIKCDVYGNMYAGCGDGVEVWNVGGTMLGKIVVGGGATNLTFGNEGEIFICNETRLWRVQLAKETIGAFGYVPPWETQQVKD